MRPTRNQIVYTVLGLSTVTTAISCSQTGEPLERTGDEIIVAGQLFHTGTPVVLWLDPGGYDAYRARRHFEPDEYMPAHPADPGNPNRYNQRSPVSDELEAKVEQEGWALDNLRQQIDQFVYHYDACGTSARCFKVLQDLRGLSVHFMLDLDGTLYQTLDLKERAWHAGQANGRCVGVEIANIGAYRQEKKSTLDEWYARDEQGPYVVFPDSLPPEETWLRTPGFVARPSRKELISGRINGSDLFQYDYTDEQYAALIKLTAALARIFPKLTLDAPRNPDGTIRMDVFSAEELEAYHGFMGHQHVTKAKVDPGPAFNWERIIRGARRELGW